MIQIEDTLVSLDIFDEMFCCDLNRCKGQCCVEGDSGAPLLEEEIEPIKEALPIVWDLLSQEARIIINKQGVSYLDKDGDQVTSIVNGKDCVFTCYDEADICYCALEKMWREGKTSFKKPISCSLYPIRLQALSNGLTALNYHKWSVCHSACELGRNLKLPIYQFLKEPLIQAFGEEWYKQLCLAAEWLKKHPQTK